MELTQYIVCVYDVYTCMCLKPKFHKTIFFSVMYSDIVFSTLICHLGKKVWLQVIKWILQTINGFATRSLRNTVVCSTNYKPCLCTQSFQPVF